MDADQVEDGGLQHGALHQAAQGTGAVPVERDVRPPDVLLHQAGQVEGVHVVGEVVLVDLEEVVGPVVVVVTHSTQPALVMTVLTSIRHSTLSG